MRSARRLVRSLGLFPNLLVVSIGLWAPPAWSALIPGLISDFQSGTTEDWTGGRGAVANLPDAGPGGTGDNALQIGGGPNLGTYNPEVNGVISPAVTAIRVDLMRPTDDSALDIRLVLFGPTTDDRWTSTVAAEIPNDGLWATYTFSIVEDDLTQVLGTGSYADLALNLDRIMFRYDPGTPSSGGSFAFGTLGIDNVRAIPEPGTALLLAGGLVGMGLLRRPRALD